MILKMRSDQHNIRSFLIFWTFIVVLQVDVLGIRKPLKVVNKCPSNEFEWTANAANMNCTEKESYHCLLIEGGDSFGKKCIDGSLITSGFCPIFTIEGYLHWAPCSDRFCPILPYRSDEVYQYQVCYKKTDNPIQKNTEKGPNGSGSLTVVPIVIVSSLVFLISGLVLALVVFYKKNIFGFKDIFQRSITDVENGDASDQADPLLRGSKLNPNGAVKNGIVITESITAALKILKTRNVVILKGAIGCGKTQALKSIENHFKETYWETEWVESKTFQGQIPKEKPTILLCDNFFGKFGSSVFSQMDVDKTEYGLYAIHRSNENIKVVIGIHTHVYDEVRKNLKLNFFHQKNITVEMDKLSEAEVLLIFKEQLQKGHCNQDPNCWFKAVGFQSVLDNLSKNQGLIGGPFLSLMYCNQHELFSEEAFSVNPVQSLMQQFKRMRSDSPTLYCCLLYLMVVQEHNCEKEPEKWAEQISAYITKEELEKIAAKSGYVQLEGKKATLAHELLSMVLFQSANETPELLYPIIQNCEDDIITQLLRPQSCMYDDLYCKWIDVNKNSPFFKCGKAYVWRLALKYPVPEKNHPLLILEFAKRKYQKHLIQQRKY